MANFEKALAKTPESLESMYSRMLKDRTIDKETGCWLWSNHLSQTGYGVILRRGTGKPHGGRLKRVRCHVISLCINKGDRPKNHEACHELFCPNKNCFNPQHLRWGTRSDNVRDCHISGETRVSKLNKDDVKNIRLLLKRGMMGRDIAKNYHITESAISKLKLNKTWRFV